MLIRRFFLIAGGTIGGLGTVLSITPPQFGATTGLALGTGGSLAGGSSMLAGGGTSTTPVAATPTPTPVSKPKPAGVSGTFTGANGNTQFGPVQVQITVVNGKITNAIALTYPTGSFRDQQINQQAIPYLIQETLAAQSANIQGVGGASYTSQGWANSLQSALAKAGL